MTAIVVDEQYMLKLSRDHPWMINHFRYCNSIVNVTVEHSANEIDAILREWKKGDSKWVIEDFVDVVERILLVDDCVKKDAESPHVLFFAAVGFALKNFGCRIIYNNQQRDTKTEEKNLPIVPTNTSKGPFLIYAALPKSINLIRPSPSSTTFSSLISRCTTKALVCK